MRFNNQCIGQSPGQSLQRAQPTLFPFYTHLWPVPFCRMTPVSLIHFAFHLTIQCCPPTVPGPASFTLILHTSLARPLVSGIATTKVYFTWLEKVFCWSGAAQTLFMLSNACKGIEILPEESSSSFLKYFPKRLQKSLPTGTKQPFHFPSAPANLLQILPQAAVLHSLLQGQARAQLPTATR